MPIASPALPSAQASSSSATGAPPMPSFLSTESSIFAAFLPFSGVDACAGTPVTTTFVLPPTSSVSIAQSSSSTSNASAACSRQSPASTATAVPGTTFARVPQAMDTRRSSASGASSFICMMPFSVLISGKFASGEKPIAGRPIFSS